MKIKEKIIEQIKVLEEAQQLALHEKDTRSVAGISMNILEYMKYSTENESSINI